MVDRFSNVYVNLNQAYMAGLMTAPMIIIELALMGAMYGDKRSNLAIAVPSAVVLITFWVRERADESLLTELER
jgi:hypothetical protein